jgi:tetratricopeptide (TPR) repeat protein
LFDLETLLSFANEFYTSKNYDKALSIYKKLLETKYAELIYFPYAYCLFKLNQSQNALDVLINYELYLRKKRGTTRIVCLVFNAIAKVYISQGEYKNAVATYNKMFGLLGFVTEHKQILCLLCNMYNFLLVYPDDNSMNNVKKKMVQIESTHHLILEITGVSLQEYFKRMEESLTV